MEFFSLSAKDWVDLELPFEEVEVCRLQDRPICSPLARRALVKEEKYVLMNNLYGSYGRYLREMVMMYISFTLPNSQAADSLSDWPLFSSYFGEILITS